MLDRRKLERLVGSGVAAATPRRNAARGEARGAGRRRDALLASRSSFRRSSNGSSNGNWPSPITTTIVLVELRPGVK